MGDDLDLVDGVKPRCIRCELRRHRVALGWSQEYLAHLAGLSKSFLSRVETGSRMPSMPVARTLAGLVGSSISALWPVD